MGHGVCFYCLLFHFAKWQAFATFRCRSPYLFAIGIDYLPRSLALMNEQFHFHPRCSKGKITHLLFADGLLIFAKVDLKSIKCVRDAFNDFSLACGLSAKLR